VAHAALTLSVSTAGSSAMPSGYREGAVIGITGGRRPERGAPRHGPQVQPLEPTVPTDDVMPAVAIP
jgi:hypothetical protein